jgi:hypothetical protein
MYKTFKFKSGAVLEVQFPLWYRWGNVNNCLLNILFTSSKTCNGYSKETEFSLFQPFGWYCDKSVHNGHVRRSFCCILFGFYFDTFDPSTVEFNS